MAAFFDRSRSYGVGLKVATQNPNHRRLRPILDSVLIYTRTHVVFGRLRAQVRQFTDEMAPTFTRQQLDGLSAYHIAITTLVNNRPARPLEAKEIPVPVGDPVMADRVRARWLAASRPAAGADRAAGSTALRRASHGRRSGVAAVGAAVGGIAVAMART